MLHFRSFKLPILATTAIVSMALTGCAATQERPLSANVTTQEKPFSANTEKPFSVNTENILKIHEGMASDKILEMFGPPKSVSQAVCGGAVGKPWTCTTWEYGEGFSDRSSFTFSGDHGSLILNDFDVHRK
jgi:hypothetical protein